MDSVQFLDSVHSVTGTGPHPHRASGTRKPARRAGFISFIVLRGRCPRPAGNIAVEMVGHTLVVVHGVTHPNDTDWEVYLDALRRNVDVIDSQLVVTDGGSPDSAQRKTSLDLAAGLWERTPPTAVVTSAVLARGAVTALSWFMKDRIRAFARAELDEACAFIGASSEKTVLREVVTRLRATLG